MRRFARVALTTFAATLCSIGTAHAADDDDGYADTYDQADAAAEAYLDGDGRAYRLLVTDLMTTLPEASIDELQAQSDALIDLAAERSAEGLEPLLVATVEELDDRGYDGFMRARDQLEVLSAAYWNSEAVLRPNARVPLLIGGPIVRHVPLGLVRGTLEGQLDIGDAEFERVLELDICSEIGITMHEQRFGAEQADLLRQLCDRMYGGSGGAMGPLGGMSEEDCFGTEDQTRSQRLHDLLKDCLESAANAGQSPVAVGRSPRMANSPDDLIERVETGHNASMRFIKRTEIAAVEVEQEENGTRTRYYDGGGAILKEEVRNEDGEVVYETWEESHPDAEGYATKVVVEILDEGDITTEIYTDKKTGERLVVERDADGNVISSEEFDAKGNPKSGGDPVADTAECFEFELALAHERSRAFLESNGIGPRPHVVNPGPENPEGAEMPGDDCFGDDYGPSAEDTFGCVDQIVLCEFGSLPDANCDCQPSTGVVDADAQCAMVMMCMDGSTPQRVGGMCECVGSEEGFEDPGLIGPTPDPMAEGEIFENHRW